MASRWTESRKAVPLLEGVAAAEAQFRLAECLGQQNQVEDALIEFERVTILYAHEPWASEAQFQIGLCWEAMGEPAKAKAAFERLIARYPESKRVADAKKRLQAG